MFIQIIILLVGLALILFGANSPNRRNRHFHPGDGGEFHFFLSGKG